MGAKDIIQQVKDELENKSKMTPHESLKNKYMKWEYFVKWYQPADGKVYSDLNILGDEGWELVSVIINDQDVFRCFFKRPKP